MAAEGPVVCEANAAARGHRDIGQEASSDRHEYPIG